MNDEIQTEGELIPLSGTAYTAMVEAETAALIDKQIATAKAYPRSITKFMADLKTCSTPNKRVAASMFYKLPRGGKQIMGPSVRLAEVAAQCFKNLRVQAQIVDENETEVVARGMSHDVENNVAWSVEVHRRCTGRDGRRYNDDMLTLVKNVAVSIAKRQAVFAAIPKAYIDDAYEECMKVALADGRTIEQRRADMVARFKELGVSEKQICRAVSVVGIQDVGEFQIRDLIGIYSAIQNGEQTIEDYYTDDETELKRASEEMKKAVAENRTGKRKEKPTGPEQQKSKIDPGVTVTDSPGLFGSDDAAFEAENPKHEHP